jgi:hypothetical protein
MCCKVLHIAEFDKPANQWCPHIAEGGGCSIYETRFDVCRGFQCFWLLGEELGAEWQPNRCKFVMHQVDGSAGLWVNVDRNYPLAWQRHHFTRSSRHGPRERATVPATSQFASLDGQRSSSRKRTSS